MNIVKWIDVIVKWTKFNNKTIASTAQQATDKWMGEYKISVKYYLKITLRSSFLC